MIVPDPAMARCSASPKRYINKQHHHKTVQLHNGSVTKQQHQQNKIILGWQSYPNFTESRFKFLFRIIGLCIEGQTNKLTDGLTDGLMDCRTDGLTDGLRD
jgi:hypothetical protein